MRPFFSNAGRTIRSFITNPFVWAGVGGLFLLGLILYIVVDSFLMPQFTRHDDYVEVPDVRNYSVVDAERQLASLDLQSEQVMERFSPEAPRDAVIDQNPGPNTRVKPGRRIYLTVNSGRQSRVLVPRLRDLSIREARSRLAAVGLTAGELRPDSIPSPYPNTITRQSPAAGDSLNPGGTVNLWYSTGLGSSFVSMPDLVGLTIQEAEEVLQSARLRFVVIGADEMDVDDEAVVRVVRQSREPGTRVREGFEIRLFVGDDADEEEIADDSAAFDI